MQYFIYIFLIHACVKMKSCMYVENLQWQIYSIRKSDLQKVIYFFLIPVMLTYTINLSELDF